MSAAAWGLLALFLAVLLALSWPLGIWLSRVSTGRLPLWMHRVEAPLYRLAGTTSDRMRAPWLPPITNNSIG